MKNYSLFLMLSIASSFCFWNCGGAAKNPTTATNTDSAQHAANPITSAATAPTVNPAADRTFIPLEKVGAITKSTTRTQLDEIYGKANVKDDVAYVGEGTERAATYVFPQSPDELVILWDDEDKKVGVGLIMMTSETSNWSTASGIKIGTTLAELETINGKPIKFTGFGWDFGGNVIDLNGGAIPSGFGITLGETAQLDPSFYGDTEIMSDKAKGLDKTKVKVVSINTSVK